MAALAAAGLFSIAPAIYAQQEQESEIPQIPELERVEQYEPEELPAAARTAVSAEMLNKTIADWPESHKQAIQKLTEKYGQPDEFTPSFVVWQNADMTNDAMNPFIYITVTKQEWDHEFPVSHKDYLMSAINYEIPAEKATELTKFDGSLYFDRTKGHMAAMCDQEAANILTLNLAHDIITGSKSVEEARQFFADTVAKFKSTGEMPDYMQKLQFEVAKSGTADPGESVEPSTDQQQASDKEETEQQTQEEDR